MRTAGQTKRKGEPIPQEKQPPKKQHKSAHIVKQLVFDHVQTHADLKVKCGKQVYKIHKAAFVCHSETLAAIIKCDDPSENIVDFTDVMTPDVCNSFIRALQGNLDLFECKLRVLIPIIVQLEKYNCKALLKQAEEALYSIIRSTGSFLFLIVADEFQTPIFDKFKPAAYKAAIYRITNPHRINWSFEEQRLYESRIISLLGDMKKEDVIKILTQWKHFDEQSQAQIQHTVHLENVLRILKEQCCTMCRNNMRIPQSLT